MFSPDGPVGGSIAPRNPRRRQRTSSDDHIALRQTTKRRKRSLLAPDSFEPPTNHRRDTNTPQVNGNGMANGHAPGDRRPRDVSVDNTSLAIRNRGSKKADREKRVAKSAEGVTQVSIQGLGLKQSPSDWPTRRKTTTT